MKLQRQGFNECQLATIAMLADKSLDEVRDVTCKMLGTSIWLPLSLSPAAFWLCVEALCLYYGLTKIHPRINQMITGSTLPNLVGKGQITIEFHSKESHAMAYEDGLIYDPNGDKPVTWEEWLAGMAEWYPDKHVSAMAISRIDQ